MTTGNERLSRAKVAVRCAGLLTALAVGAAAILPAAADAAAPTLTEYQTTGYQPLGYSATPFQATTSAGSSLLSPVTAPAITAAGSTSGTVLSVDPSETYQTMQGYGATLNDSAAYLLSDGLPTSTLATQSGINAVAGSAAMQAMFSNTNGISLSYLRISIGGNDFAQSSYSTATPTLANDYVENDPAPGSTATSFSAGTLSNFIAHDQEYLIPVLKAAVQDNSQLKIMAAAWTAPGWMKCQNYEVETAGASCQAFATTGSDPGYAGGTLNPQYEAQYADYLLEFILAYRAEGLTVSAVSLGNEPMNDDFSYPSMVMLPNVEAQVAADLKQGLSADGLSTQIIGLDHNWNTEVATTQPSGECTEDCYAPELLSDAASGTISDIGYHCYGGDPSEQDTVTTGIMETECSTQGFYTDNANSSAANPYTTQPSSFASSLVWDTGYLGILSAEDGDTGNVSGAGSSTEMLWNLAGDNSYGITINPGCDSGGSAGNCLPVVDDASTGSPVAEVGYYILGQFSKFVQPGAVRIGSSSSGDLDTVAFQNPDGQTVMVVLDTAGLSCSSTTCSAPTSTQAFTVQENGYQFKASIAADTVQTYTW